MPASCHPNPSPGLREKAPQRERWRVVRFPAIDAAVRNWLRSAAKMSIVRHQSTPVYSKCVEANGFVFTAGIVASDLDAGIKAQTEQVLVEIDALLKLAGSHRSKIVMANVWLSDLRLREGANEAWTAWVGSKENAPARATVEAKLVDPRMLVEIAVVAVK